MPSWTRAAECARCSGLLRRAVNYTRPGIGYDSCSASALTEMEVVGCEEWVRERETRMQKWATSTWK